MGNYVTTNALVTPSTSIKDSQQTAYPSSNALLVTRPYRPWKSDASFATSNYVGIDLTASPATVQYVLVDAFNVDKVVIEADTSTSFNTAAGSPEYSSGNLHLSNLSLDMYSRGAVDLMKVIHYAGGITKRYWRVRPGTGAAITDDDTKFRVGSFMVFSDGDTWETNTGPDLAKELIWPVLPNDNGLSGGRNPVEVGKPYARVYIPPTELFTAMESTLATVIAYGEHQPFLFWENGVVGSTSDVEYSNPYLVHRVGLSRIARAQAGYINLSQGMVLEEVGLG